VIGNIQNYRRLLLDILKEHFKNADLHTGYFCYNCTYFIKPNHCAIVEDGGGPDVYESDSGIIAPCGSWSKIRCYFWKENSRASFDTFTGNGTIAKYVAKIHEPCRRIDVPYKDIRSTDM
jgi:hypothetical protein